MTTKIGRRKLPKSTKTSVAAVKNKADENRRASNFERVVAAFAGELDECQSAFGAWRNAVEKADDALYAALGRVYQAYRNVAENRDAFLEYAKAQDGVKIDHRKTVFHYMINLSDLDVSASTCSQYAACLHYALHEKVAFEANAFIDFLKRHGKITQAADEFRQLNRERTKTRGRRSNYEIGQLRAESYPNVPTVDFADTGDEPGLFVILGERREGQKPTFLPITLNDEKAVRVFFESLAKKPDA